MGTFFPLVSLSRLRRSVLSQEEHFWTMQPARRRPRPEVQHPDSQRWQTTLSSDLERVAKQLEGSDAYDTTKRMAKVKETKLSNQVTSISFGNEIVSAQEGDTLVYLLSFLTTSHLQ